MSLRGEGKDPAAATRLDFSSPTLRSSFVPSSRSPTPKQQQQKKRAKLFFKHTLASVNEAFSQRPSSFPLTRSTSPHVD